MYPIWLPGSRQSGPPTRFRLQRRRLLLRLRKTVDEATGLAIYKASLLIRAITWLYVGYVLWTVRAKRFLGGGEPIVILALLGVGLSRFMEIGLISTDAKPWIASLITGFVVMAAFVLIKAMAQLKK